MTRQVLTCENMKQRGCVPSHRVADAQQDEDGTRRTSHLTSDEAPRRRRVLTVSRCGARRFFSSGATHTAVSGAGPGELMTRIGHSTHRAAPIYQQWSPAAVTARSSIGSDR
jgi:hypothetical protein